MRLKIRTRPDLPPKSNLRLFFFGFGFLILGMISLESLILPLKQNFQYSRWPTVDCTILVSEARPWGNVTGNLHVPYVRFTYDRNGSSHTGSYFNTSESLRPADKAQVLRQLRLYPAGARTVCHVDPGQPGRAYLLRPVTRGWLPLWAAWIPLAAAGVCLLKFLQELPREYLPCSDHL